MGRDQQKGTLEDSHIFWKKWFFQWRAVAMALAHLANVSRVTCQLKNKKIPKSVVITLRYLFRWSRPLISEADKADLMIEIVHAACRVLEHGGLYFFLGFSSESLEFKKPWEIQVGLPREIGQFFC